MLVSAAYSVSGMRSYFSWSKTPKLRVNNNSEFSILNDLCMIEVVKNL